ncbi:hypothetical protein [Streptomyces sp. NPDC058620]|uniref:hypothetical protein n=1 Tax=Streptomyces sp. NPDC058620 TaxID=3346560 RepID=UPI003653ACE2
MVSRTAESAQGSEKDGRPPCAASAVPAATATASTSVVAMATVRGRRGGASPELSVAWSSGKLRRPMPVVPPP